jgi:hypothetical protein
MEVIAENKSLVETNEDLGGSIRESVWTEYQTYQQRIAFDSRTKITPLRKSL